MQVGGCHTSSTFYAASNINFQKTHFVSNHNNYFWYNQYNNKEQLKEEKYKNSKRENITLSNSYSLLSFIPIIFIKPVGNISHPSHERRHSWNKKYRTWRHISTINPALKFIQQYNNLLKNQIWSLWYDLRLISFKLVNM